jgi:hypothetical protein
LNKIILSISYWVLVSTATLSAAIQSAFEGNFNASSWENKNVELSASEKGTGLKTTWALSPTDTYGWCRLKVKGLELSSKIIKIKLSTSSSMGLQVILGYVNPNKKLPSLFYSHPQNISGSPEGKDAILNLSEFVNDQNGDSFKPNDALSTINVIMFKAKGTKPFVVYLEEIAFGDTGDFQIAESKSLISESKLFTLLDPAHAGVAPAITAEKTGDHAKAIHLLTDYFRNRTSPSWLFDPHVIDKTVTFNQKAADDGAAAQFSMLKATYQYPNGVIDWTYNPTTGKSYATAEWVFSLNRMGWWGDLGNAYWATGDSKYAKAFVQQMLSYFKTQPCPEVQNENVGSTWRELEVGQRIQISWLGAYHRFLHAPEITDEALISMIRSMMEQGQYLRKCPPEPGNHHLIGMNGLYVLGCMFPEFQMAKNWRDYAMQEMMVPFQHPQEGWLADGMWYERAPGYHQWLVGKNLLIAKTAKIAGFLQEIPDVFFSMLKKAAEFNIRLTAPDRTVPTVNDCGDQNMLKMNIDDASFLFPESPVLKWLRDVQSNLSPTAPSDMGSQFLNGSGYVVMRTGLATNDSYLLFDVGDLGGWHGHKDKLNIVLYLNGREVLYDNGGGDYDTSPFRRYAISTKSHNTVLVDGKNQFRPFTENDPAGTDLSETPQPTVSFSPTVERSTAWFVGNYTDNDVQDKTGKAVAEFKHRREIVFLKPQVVVVVDTLFPSDKQSHDYDLRWHSRTTDWKLGDDSTSVSAWTRESSSFLILPLSKVGLKVSGHVGEKNPELIGWDVVHGEAAKPALTVKNEKSGTGTQRFVTLLTVQKNGEAPAQVKELNPNEWNVVVSEVTYQIKCPANFQEGVEIRLEK